MFFLVNKATEAAGLAQTIQTDEDWKKLADTWQQAIDLMNAVPVSDVHYETAQQKVAEYQRNFEYAQSNNATPVNIVQVPKAPPTEPAVPIAQKTSRLQTGMTFDFWGWHLLDVIDQGFDPDYTIADGGSRLRAGQKAVLPETPCHGDVFHIQQQFEQVANGASPPSARSDDEAHQVRAEDCPGSADEQHDSEAGHPTG